MRSKLTNEQFIKKSYLIHKNKYNYKLVNYENSSNKVIIICLIHGQFEQSPNHHLKGHGCSHCAGITKSNTQEFIKKQD